MNLGPLDRRGVLYLNSPVAGDGGAPVDTLTPLRTIGCTAWGEGDDAKDDLIGQRVSTDGDGTWRCRWFEGLVPSMFIVIEGNTYRITRRKELGRRAGWQFWGQEIR